MDPVPAGNPAQVYENYFVPAMFRPWALELLRHAALRAGEKVLDVACGTGIVSREAAAVVGTDGEMVGLERNPAMLAVARSQASAPGAQLRWQEGDAQSLPFPDERFDAVLCQHGLPFFPDRTAAVAEMRRVLAPGGRAVAMVLQSLDQHPVFEALMTSVARHLDVPLSTVAVPFSMSDSEDFRELFLAAEFSRVEVVSATISAEFGEPRRFVPLAVASSAAAIPAFAGLADPARVDLVEAVRLDAQAVLDKFRLSDSLVFPMFALVARGFV
jgi:ubiquinone/menaquinone biosynthesis C-methylase UbiE